MNHETEIQLTFYFIIAWFMIGLILLYGAFLDWKRIQERRRLGNLFLKGEEK